MRAAMAFLGLVLIVGCGERRNHREEDDTPAPVRATKPDSPKSISVAVEKSAPTQPKVNTPPRTDPEFSASSSAILMGYYEGEFAADAKYRGKYGTIDIGEIIATGRDDSGTPYIATHNFGHNPAPNGFFYFAPGQEAELAKLRKGQSVRVTGKCLGKKADGINRGIRGYEWRVNFVDCKVVGPVPRKEPAK